MSYFELDPDGYMQINVQRSVSDGWREYREDSTEEIIKQAKAAGHKVLTPYANELFIDIDTDEQYEDMKSRLRNFPNMMFMTAKITRDVPSMSGLPHRHVTVTLGEDVDNMTRAAMQMFLCSDPVREILAVRRVLQGVSNPIIFIEGDNWKDCRCL